MLSCSDQLFAVLNRDIAGQERFGNMTRVYYKEAVGALISFDVSRPETLQHTINWKEDLGIPISMESFRMTRIWSPGSSWTVQLLWPRVGKILIGLHFSDRKVTMADGSAIPCVLLANKVRSQWLLVTVWTRICQSFGVPSCLALLDCLS